MAVDLGTIVDKVTRVTTAWLQYINDTVNGLGNTSNVSLGDALIGVKQEDADAVGNTLHFYMKMGRKKLLNYVTTAQGDDILSGAATLDVSTAYTKALTRAAGGILEVPRGVALVSAQQSIPANTVIEGEGPRSSILRLSGSGYDGLLLAGNSSGVVGLQVSSTAQRTSGANIKLAASMRGQYILDFMLQNAFVGIDIQNGVVICYIERGEILDTTSTTGISILINGGNDHFIQKVVADASGTQPLAGIKILKSDATWLQSVDMIHQGNGLHLAPAGTDQITWLFASDSAFDTGNGTGIRFEPGASALIKGSNFVNCWSSTNVTGVELTGTGTIDGTLFAGHRCYNNNQSGYVLSSTASKNTIFDGCKAAGNSLSSAGTYSGWDIAAGVSQWHIRGGRSGDEAGFAASQQARGILVNAGASNNYSIVGVDVRGNVTGILDNGTGTNKFVGQNLGYVSKNQGASSVAVGTSSIAVTHGLAKTPPAGGINVMPTQSMVTSGISAWWVSAIGATTFTVNTNTNVTTSAFTFEWNAAIQGE